MYICLQSPTLVCPESSSPAHSLASFRKPECFSSWNSNTTLRSANNNNINTLNFKHNSRTLSFTIVDFLWRMNYPLHQATWRDSIQLIAIVLLNRTKQHVADLSHHICAKRQQSTFSVGRRHLWKRCIIIYKWWWSQTMNISSALSPPNSFLKLCRRLLATSFILVRFMKKSFQILLLFLLLID